GDHGAARLPVPVLPGLRVRPRLPGARPDPGDGRLRCHVLHADRLPWAARDGRHHYTGGDPVALSEGPFHQGQPLRLRSGRVVLALRGHRLGGAVHLRVRALTARLGPPQHPREAPSFGAAPFALSAPAALPAPGGAEDHRLWATGGTMELIGLSTPVAVPIASRASRTTQRPIRIDSALTVRVPLPRSVNMKYRAENRLATMAISMITTKVLASISNLERGA